MVYKNISINQCMYIVSLICTLLQLTKYCMQTDRLTNTGIEKILNKIPSVVVQILDVVVRIKGDDKYYVFEISDGYTKIKNCIIVQQEFTKGNKVVKDLNIVQIQQFQVQIPKKNSITSTILIEKLRIIDANQKSKVGNPIPYEQFIKNGRSNPNGDNLIPKQKNKLQPKPNIKLQPKPNIKQEPKYKKVIDIIQQDSYNSRRQTSQEYSHRSKNPPKHESKPTNPPKSKKLGAIVKVTPQKQMGPKRSGYSGQPQQSLIKNLTIGTDSNSIIGRVLLVAPIRQVMTKKGTQSPLLIVQFGDSSGTIDCTVFGEAAIKFQNTFKEDEVYELLQVFVTESIYQGNKQVKISLSENSKVNYRKDDHKIPYIQDFALTVQKVMELGVGESCRLICLVKDPEQVDEFVSKAGKPMRKKVIQLCDPVAEVQISVALLGDRSSTTFDNCPYLIEGVVISQYRGFKQYNLKSNWRCRPVPQHSFRRYIKDLNSIQFTNPSSNQKDKQKASISNFSELNNVNDAKDGVWSEVICYFISIRFSTKNYYIGCPHCKKKVLDLVQGICGSCNKQFAKAQYRYLLNVCLCDAFDTVWALAYDAAAEQLLNFKGSPLTAEQFAKLDQNTLKEIVETIRMKEYKMKLVTKQEEYGGETRKKTNLIKVTPVDYVEETKSMLGKLKQHKY